MHYVPCQTLAGSGCCFSDEISNCLQHKLEDAEKYMSAALSEAIKGFGDDDPHVAAARQNLAEQYRVMHKYNSALPLYNRVRSACRPYLSPTCILSQAAEADVPGRDCSIRQEEGAV